MVTCDVCGHWQYEGSLCGLCVLLDEMFPKPPANGTA